MRASRAETKKSLCNAGMFISYIGRKCNENQSRLTYMVFKF